MATKNESAFKQELILLVAAISVAAIWQVSLYEKLALVISVLFVIFAEIVNTAIKSVVDWIGLEIHPLSGLAKDLGSAAVLLSLAICILVWVFLVNMTWGSTNTWKATIPNWKDYFWSR